MKIYRIPRLIRVTAGRKQKSGERIYPEEKKEKKKTRKNNNKKRQLEFPAALFFIEWYSVRVSVCFCVGAVERLVRRSGSVLEIEPAAGRLVLLVVRVNLNSLRQEQAAIFSIFLFFPPFSKSTTLFLFFHDNQLPTLADPVLRYPLQRASRPTTTIQQVTSTQQ